MRVRNQVYAKVYNSAQRTILSQEDEAREIGHVRARYLQAYFTQVIEL